MTKREYTIKEIRAVVAEHKAGKSIRNISEFWDIPKSVVGRWVKDPEHWKQTYRFRDVERKIQDPERRAKYRRAVHKFRSEPEKYADIEADYIEEGDYYEFDS